MMTIMMNQEMIQKKTLSSVLFATPSTNLHTTKLAIISWRFTQMASCIGVDTNLIN